jgi:hypothetical protein
VRWRREEEFGFEPVSPAMVSTGACRRSTGAGRPADWTTEIWSGRHSKPARAAAATCFAAEALPTLRPAPPASESSVQPGAGTRNGEPLYDFTAKRIIHHLIQRRRCAPRHCAGSARRSTSSRSKSLLDELAAEAGENPVAYRLSLLRDPRARAVVEQVAAMAGWQPGTRGGAGKGRGIGFARYKNLAAYAAVIADVEVEQEVRVQRVWCACDSGLVINPDGAINQLEGGIVQAISWALKEGVRLDTAGISSRDWRAIRC